MLECLKPKQTHSLLRSIVGEIVAPTVVERATFASALKPLTAEASKTYGCDALRPGGQV